MKHIEALNQLNELAFAFYTAGTFAAASNLEVFNYLGGDGLTPVELAKKVAVHPDAALRLLSAIENLGLVEKNECRYKNTELGSYLHKDHLVPMGFSQKDNYFHRLWEYLPDAMREYSPRHQQAWNKSAGELYQAIYSDEKKLRSFFKLLDSYNVPIGQEAASCLNLSSYNHILDLAGGTGSFSAEVIKAHPHLSATCLDLEPVRHLSQEMIEKNELQERFEFITGDMFNLEAPKGVDVIFLSYILHNWNDDKCQEILKGCYDALPPGGMLVISEKVLNNDHSGDWWAVMMNLQMLVAFEPGAKERTLNEYVYLIEMAGFKNFELISLDAPRDLLIAFKPS
jgi:ubiquinone/menaquinone biosynthesis C-methylase UbiE